MAKCAISGLECAEFQHGGNSYCESCAPKGSKKVRLGLEEWFVCWACSFCVNYAETLRHQEARITAELRARG